MLTVNQRQHEVQRKRLEIGSMLERMIDGKTADEMAQDKLDELNELFKTYRDLYMDYGSCRQREVGFHLRQMRKLLLPTGTTKLCLWVLQQDRSFYNPRSAFFKDLTKAIDLSPDQVEIPVTSTQSHLKPHSPHRSHTLTLTASLRPGCLLCSPGEEHSRAQD
jgi:hypothetical protein